MADKKAPPHVALVALAAEQEARPYGGGASSQALLHTSFRLGMAEGMRQAVQLVAGAREECELAERLELLKEHAALTHDVACALLGPQAQAVAVDNPPPGHPG